MPVFVHGSTFHQVHSFIVFVLYARYPGCRMTFHTQKTEHAQTGIHNVHNIASQLLHRVGYRNAHMLFTTLCRSCIMYKSKTTLL